MYEIRWVGCVCVCVCVECHQPIRTNGPVKRIPFHYFGLREPFFLLLLRQLVRLLIMFSSHMNDADVHLSICHCLCTHWSLEMAWTTIHYVDVTNFFIHGFPSHTKFSETWLSSSTWKSSNGCVHVETHTLIQHTILLIYMPQCGKVNDDTHHIPI